MMTNILAPAVRRWAFIAGIVIALLVGLIPAGTIPVAGTILFILGLLVGFLNVTEKDSTPFLVAVIALLLIGVAGLQLQTLTAIVASILSQFIAFVSAAGLVVAIKQAIGYARA